MIESRVACSEKEGIGFELACPVQFLHLQFLHLLFLLAMRCFRCFATLSHVVPKFTTADIFDILSSFVTIMVVSIGQHIF
jgi:hypothetical protein